MKCKVISTGSKGNAVIVNDEILVDCGVPYEMIEPYAAKLNYFQKRHSSDLQRKSD